MIYRRKRIPGLPPEPTRALDDEFARLEQATGSDLVSGTQTDLSVANITATTLDVVSSTGTDATIPASTATTAGLATATQITKLDGIEAGAVADGSAGDAFAAAPLLTSVLDMDDWPAIIRNTAGAEVGSMGYSTVMAGPALAHTVAGVHPAGTGGIAVTSAGTTIDGRTTFLGNLDLDDLAMVIRNTGGTEVGTLGYSTVWAGPALAHTVGGVHPAGTGGIAVTAAGTTIDGPTTFLGNLDIQDQVVIVRDAGGTAVGQLGFNPTYAGLSLGYTVGGVHPATSGGIAFNSTRTIIDGDVTVTDLAAGPVYADAAGLLYTGGTGTGTDLSIYGITATTVGVASSTGTDVLLPAATVTTAGVATAAQITTLGTALKWRGQWAAGTYVNNDVVQTNRWLARANKTTTASPIPASGNGRRNIYPTDPAWTSQTEASIYWGQRINSVVTKTIVHGIRIRIPNAATCAIYTGDGTSVTTQIVDGITPSTTWTMYFISPIVVPVGAIFDVLCNAGSHYYNNGYFVPDPNVRGFKITTYPPTALQLVTTRYGIDLLIEQPGFNADWDYLSGH